MHFIKLLKPWQALKGHIGTSIVKQILSFTSGTLAGCWGGAHMIQNLIFCEAVETSVGSWGAPHRPPKWKAFILPYFWSLCILLLLNDHLGAHIARKFVQCILQHLWSLGRLLRTTFGATLPKYYILSNNKIIGRPRFCNPKNPGLAAHIYS